MIYFKKKLIKNFVINLYILINSFLVIINSLFYRGNQKKDQIKIFYGGSLTGNIGGTLVKIKRLRKKFKNNYFGYNCVYLLSNSLYLNKYAIQNLKKNNIPIIHNQNGVYYKGWYGEGWEKKNIEMSFQFHSADYVFYQSKFSKFCSEKFLGKREGPGEILYNAVDTDFFQPKENKVLSSKLKILVTGKYQEHLYENLKFTVNVLKRLIDNKIEANINFAGYYDVQVKKKLINLSHQYGIQDNIEFSGVYSQENANVLYSSSDIIFYFVHQSNCPNSVIEAMSCGLPILSTNTGGLPEIVGNHSGVCWKLSQVGTEPFLPNLNDALNGIKKIIINYSDYSNNSINKVAKDHNINNWIKKT
jgi:glycosyltransferase involved in cell wall biosynthesis